MNKTILIIIVILVAIVGGYFLLRGGYQTPTPTAPEVTAPEVTPEEEAPEITPGVKEVIVVGTEYSFSPSTITVEAGQQVKINFQNGGSINHNLIIEELGVSSRTIGGDNSDIVEFIAPTSGVYTIFCSVPGHRAAGMVGSLKVE